MHHIVSDGWSMGVLVKEVGEYYSAYSEGRELEKEELEIQYADYAVWQREQMSSERMKQEMEYWKKQLGGEIGVMELPGGEGEEVEGEERRAGVEVMEVGKGDRE